MRRRPRHRRAAFALLVPVVLVATLLTGAPTIPEASATPAHHYSGSDLWLRYPPISDPALRKRYAKSATTVIVQNAGKNPVHRHTRDLRMEPGSREHLVATSLEAAKDELARGLEGLLGREVPVSTKPGQRVPDGAVVVGTPETSQLVRRHAPSEELRTVGDEGYLIRSVSRGRHDFTVIAANTEIGALYGTFAFLRRMQTQQPITGLDVTEKPRIANRHLNYWETERLYAGNDATGTGGLNGENGAVFNFAATGESADRNLPVILDRYLVVARALASVGVNGITINNVNADNAYLTREYVEQTAALADALRPYGIRVALSVKYTAPTDERFAPDTLTEDQLDPYGAEFRDWWHRKAEHIRDAIPDFTGFTVKANSEGQPGPQDFGYDHGDGANGIAAALAPLGMTVYWRTFVYNADVDDDRLKRAYLEFGHIDDEPQDDGSTGRFADNVFLQTKNGPLDFQAREPFNPMFGRLENTNQALELQITQEYTGQNTMLCYLGPMWQEVLRTDTYTTDEHGELLDDRLVGHIVDGTAQGHPDTAIVGVANLGNADNLTGHHFSQANLFAFGRLAWDWTLDSERIATDWVRMTWSNDDRIVDTIVRMMMGSWEALVSYQTPLGVAHQFADGEHYEPYPSQWFMKDDWSPVYYNKADSAGLGYDRSPTGSDFTAQYFPTLAERYGDIESTPENLLMWFHHVPWDHRMDNGRIFWEELVYRYQMGVQYVTWMRETWDSLKPSLDARRWAEVRDKLVQHEIDAADWRDTNVEYWQEFSGREIPVDDGPLSATFVVNGTEHGGFDLSADSYRIPVAAGGSPTITEVRTADLDARYEIVSQADNVPGTAVVKVTGQSFFGPLVKNYVLELVPDTTLASLSVNGAQPASFDPDVHHYNTLLPPDAESVATVEAVAHDPAATVRVEQADHPTGRATVTVTNGGSSTVYTVDFGTALDGSDEFDPGELDDRWRWVRHDADAVRLADGALVITAQQGDLEGEAGSAKNLALQEVDGDWTAESRLVFSRPLAHDNEQGGLVAYADDDNYVKLAWEMADEKAEINKLRVVLLTEESGKATSMEVTGADAQRIVGEDGAIWLRLVKLGNTYKAYYSGDGEVYRFFGATTLSAEPAHAGLVAFNGPATSTGLDVAFDWFHIDSHGDPVPAR
ncbi:alpha-glucuronidase family glycosyl hydrolase [Saccharomonospora cyanea]|uniref:Xylan alpha-1,2-glucuronidase n=1 Tax=Saccharomonospora cyanea NA-134 TaxID=882082 RepID=H5XPQ4_9PSEU|nr:alpha-glucuronidase family glycosyl hydrolase [Saccharomonospora cyanea]EHR61132.1 alpha-glucuronidase [Saccharomonospora cyanea NA-134]